MRVIDEVRRFLSFKDLCASRSVCTEWANIKRIPYAYPVEFFEDASDVADFPDSSNMSFRACLLCATLHVFHCDIFTTEQLHFVQQLFPSLKELTIEFQEEDLEVPSDFFSHAVKLRKLELIMPANIGLVVDFKALRNLTHLEVNYAVECRNYDKRHMTCFQYDIEEWNNVISDIAFHSQTIRILWHYANPNPCPYWIQFLHLLKARLLKDPKTLPQRLELTQNSMTFCVVTPSAFRMCPVFGFHGSDNEEFTIHYLTALGRMFLMWPDLSLEFDDGCDQRQKTIWLELMNPIRAELGQPLFLQDGSLQKLQESKE